MQAEHNRQIANLIKQGNIADTNPSECRVRVAFGGLLTDWLPYFVPFAGGVSVHRPPSVGENCIVLSPSGEIANGLVLCGLASTQFAAPSHSADETVIVFPDGAKANYNHASGSLNVSGMKKIVIDCPDSTFTGKVTVQGLFTYQAGMQGANGSGGTTQITGDFVHTGSLNNTGEISSNGIVLATHTHSETNGSETGAPK